MKYGLILVALLSLLLNPPFLLAKKKAVKKKTSATQMVEKKPVSEALDQDQEFNEAETKENLKNEIEENIDTLKFDTDLVSQKRAFNYLLDHIAQAEAFLYEELKNPEIEDYPLSNLFTLLTALNHLKTDQLILSVKKQLNKPNYLFLALTAIYPKDQKSAIDIVLELLYSEPVPKKSAAIKLIQTLKIQTVKAKLIQFLVKEKNPQIIQEGLRALAHLQVDLKELPLLFAFFSAESSGTAEAAALLFANYPDSLPMIIKGFKQSENFLEQMALLNALIFFKNQASEDFLLDLLKTKFFRDKAVDIFFLKQTCTPQTTARLLELAKNTRNDEHYFDSILKILTLNYNFIQPAEQIKIMGYFREAFKTEKDETILFYQLKNFYRIKFLDQDFAVIFYTLQENFTKNWRIQKMILQILDLKS